MLKGLWEQTYNITDGNTFGLRIASFGDTAPHLVAIQGVTTVADPSTTSTFGVNVTDDNGLQYGGPSSSLTVVGEHAETVFPVSGGFTIDVHNSGTVGAWKLTVAYF